MSSTIKYKGYIGSVEYSDEDKCFFGKIELIDDLVTFEATSVEELELNFKNCVDEYLETREQLENKELLNIVKQRSKIPLDKYISLEEMAKKHNIDLNDL